MTPEPIWFGPRQRPLAGFLHSPSSPCVGGVLICAPFGYEASCAHRTLRSIADRLAEQGHLALRFDYEGTGASSGSGTEPDLLGRWQDNVLAGINELRRRGIRRPTLLGLRLGAALACAAARRDRDVSALALWAPVTSGHRYRRELRAQAAITPGGVPGDGSLNVVGHYVHPDVVRAMDTWDPLDGIDPDIATVVVRSAGWRDDRRVAADFANAGLRPVFLDVDGTSDVLERDAELVRVPMKLVNALCQWVDGSGESAVLTPDLSSADRTRVLDSREGPVEEEIVAVPPHGLYGVLTRPASRVADVGVIFLNNGVAPAAGPARAWVDFARTLAASGVCSLRFDFSGIGDSPDRSHRSMRRDRAIAKTAGAELLAAVNYLRRRDMRAVTVAGLCSGANIAIRTAAYSDGLQKIFAINPSLFNLTDIGIGPWIRRLWALTAYPMGKRKVRAVVYRLPERAWTALDRVGVYPSPARYLRRAAARQTSVQLVYAEEDKALVDLQVRAGRAVAELLTAGRVSSEVVEGMDHSMFDRAPRAVVLDALREACLSVSPRALDRA